MLNHQAANADCRFSDLGQLQWQSGFCTIRLSLVNCGGTIVEFLMGVAIRNHLFTSRYHIKSWKMFKDWLLNKKGEAAGNDWNSI
ncbi:hypothetical protein Peur_048574 [Populus x canadensis]